ncbi:MAG: inositol monophosphatase family protein [Candidatus Brennerbacteria bacterium]
MHEFDLWRFQEESVQAVMEGMNIVRSYQLREKSIGEASIKKADDTFLTMADRECGVFLREFLKKQFPNIRSNIEDADAMSADSRITIYGDPVDGTLPFTVGLPTSTVILGAYDTEAKRVLSCVIGEPALRRLWRTVNGESYWWAWDLPNSAIRTPRPISVWRGELSVNTAVLLDHCQGFKRSGRQILTNDEVGKLMTRLARYRLLLTGSNGLHQAMVAQGNDKMAGAITSAIGGPQDVCGVKLVLGAGGAARAFRMNDDRTLAEESPEAIEDYDILVVGNNQNTVDVLTADLFSIVER